MNNMRKKSTPLKDKAKAIKIQKLWAMEAANDAVSNAKAAAKWRKKGYKKTAAQSSNEAKADRIWAAKRRKIVKSLQRKK